MNAYREAAPVAPEAPGEALAFWEEVARTAGQRAEEADRRARVAASDVLILSDTIRRRRARLEALRRLARAGDGVDAATLAREAPTVYPPIALAPMRVIQL